MTDLSTVPSTTKQRRVGVRSIAALLVFVIAVVLTPVGLIGHWAHRTVLDSEQYIATVGPLAAQPEVQQALTAAVTDAVLQKTNTEQNVQGLLNNLFPDSKLAGALAGPISSGIDGLISELIAKFVASDQFEKLWIDVNTLAQKGLVRVLEGKEDSVVKLNGDELVLDVSSLLGAIQQHLVDNGITAAGNITLPTADRQIVLMEAPALQQIRFVYSLANPILSWLPLLIAALFALAIGLARRRARMVVAVGIGILASAVLMKVGLDIAEAAFVDQLSGTVFAPASTVFWNTMLSYLIAGLTTTVVLGVGIVVFGWFGGRTKPARFLRGHVVTGLEEIGSRLPEGLTGLGNAVATGQVWIRWVVYAAVLLLILTNDVLSGAVVVWSAALGAGILTILQVLIGRSDADDAVEVIEVIEVTAG